MAAACLGLLTAALGAGIVAWRPSSWQGVWLVASSVSFVLFVGEVGVLAYQSRPDPWRVYNDPRPQDPAFDFMGHDPALGWSGNPDRMARSRKYDNEGTIYDVTYHSESHGLRVTPASNDSGAVITFFGCSYTFGEGLSDEETLPNQLAVATGGRYRVLNAALSGYGPHQMLRAIEVERYDSLFRRPSAFVYLAVSWQAQRSAGKNDWVAIGPRYVLDADSVRYAGTFEDATPILTRIVARSALYQVVRNRLVPLLASDDLELFVRILAQSDRILRTRYGTGLTVMYLREPSYESNLLRAGWSDDSVVSALQGRGVQVISGDTPEPPDNQPSLYRIRRDGHPTAFANAARTDSLLAHLSLGRDTPARQ